MAQIFLGGLRVHQGAVEEGGELVDRALLDPAPIGHPFAVHHAHLFRALARGMQGRPVDALRAVEAGKAAAIESGEAGTRFLAVQDNVRSWVLRSLGRLDGCGGLEAWRLTADLAAASRVDHWWRAAERRAGALIANAGEHGETLRRHVATTFTALGR